MRRHGKNRIAAIALAGAVALAAGCGDDANTANTGNKANTAAAGSSSSGSKDAAGSEEAETDLASRGERIYNVNCIACHHRDPTQDGGLGPPIAGSSRELIEARVIRGEYPPGYTPKADTRLMIPLPHLEPELDALAAFLASRAK
jgi:mono/diheme cytochrome c family protein